MAITTPLNSGSTENDDGSERQHTPPSSPPTLTAVFNQEDEDEAVRPLLARANLLRMRGQWDEAVAVCTEALRRAPQSPSAHSLLGDVYEAQNKNDEAVQWYGMACDLAPTNQADRAKLDRAVAAQHAKFAAEQKAAGIVAPAPTPKHATEKTLEWIDRVLPPGKSESVARLIFGLSGVIALMILVAAGILWQSGRNNPLPVMQGMPGKGSGLPTITSTPPVVVAAPQAAPAKPTVPVLPAARPPIASPNPSSAVGATPSTPGTVASSLPPASSGAVSAETAQIAQRFAGLLAANAQVAPTLRLQNAQIDAAQNSVQLIVVAQTVPNEAIAQTRERIVRAAVLAVRAASEANVRAVSGLVRVQMQTAQAAAPTDVFTASLPLATARDMDVWGASPADLLSRFTSLQWSPALGVAQTAAHGSNDATAAGFVQTGAPGTTGSTR